MPQIRGGKGEAVLRYCEPLPTKEMRHHTAFPKGKKQYDILLSQEYTFSEFLTDLRFSFITAWLLTDIDLCSVFYGTYGFIPSSNL
jgi:hypothetical protein